MVAGAEAIAGVLGFEPWVYRAPYGHFIPETVAEARRRGWTCVFWSALGEDWDEDATPRSVADKVLADLEPGAIALLYDSRRVKPDGRKPATGATAILARGDRAPRVAGRADQRDPVSAMDRPRLSSSLTEVDGARMGHH